MITHSVAVFLLAYLRTVQAQATICLATYGGVATRYISSAIELKQFFLDLASVGRISFGVQACITDTSK